MAIYFFATFFGFSLSIAAGDKSYGAEKQKCWPCGEKNSPEHDHRHPQAFDYGFAKQLPDLGCELC